MHYSHRDRFFIGLLALVVILTFASWNIAYDEYEPIKVRKTDKLMLAVMTDKSSKERALEFDSFYKKNHMESNDVIGPIYFFSEELQKDLKKDDFVLYKEMQTFPMVNLTIKPFIDDILIKTMIMIEYFLNNTNAAWLFRPTDDVFINPNGWPYNVLEELDKLGDPYENPYFVGECRMDGDDKLVSGGSGQFISRKAAKILYESRHDVLRNRENKWEDWHFAQFMQKIGIQNNFLPFVMSYSFSKEDYDHIMNGDFNSIEDCETRYKESDDTGCVRGLQQFSKTLVMHQYWTRTEPMLEKMQELVTKSPDNIMWYHVKDGTMVCKDNTVHI